MIDKEYNYSEEYRNKFIEVSTYIKENNINIDMNDIRKIVNSCLYDTNLDFRSFFSV
jgi:hypothetical protein